MEKVPEVCEVCNTPDVRQVQGTGGTPPRKQPWVSWVPPPLPPLLPPLLPHPDVLCTPFCLDPATGSAVCLSFDLGKVSQEFGLGWRYRYKMVRVSGSPGLQGSKSEQAAGVWLSA